MKIKQNAHMWYVVTTICERLKIELEYHKKVWDFKYESVLRRGIMRALCHLCFDDGFMIRRYPTKGIKENS